MTKQTLKSRATVFSTPAYQRIEDDLRTRIASGAWMPDVMLPSRNALAAEYGVSVPTIERAVADLLTDGTLRADSRRGTFVAAAAKILTRLPAPRRVKAATIGIISAAQHDPWQFSKNPWDEVMVNALERSITASGGMTRFYDLSNLHDRREGVAEAINSLLEDGVDALVVVFGVRNQKDEEAAYARATTLPIVFVGTGKSRLPALSVYYDNHDAGVQTAQHLLEAGCSSLIFFAPFTRDWVRERVAGAREAVLISGLPMSALHVCIGDRELEDVLEPMQYNPQSHVISAREAARTLLAQSGGLSALGVIAANDEVAFGFREAASEIGLTAGKDYALIGFDDHPDARPAGLSTLHPPLEAMGREAGRLVLSALDGQVQPMQVCLHSHLIARASSRLS